MNVLDFKLEYQQNNDKSVFAIPVVIVAAGSSLRMQGINKQFVTLCGVPAIVHTLMAFQKSKYISQKRHRALLPYGALTQTDTRLYAARR